MRVRVGSEPGAAVTVALAMAVVLLAPVARVLFPRLYLLGEDGSFVVVGLIGLAVYGAPLLGLAFVRLPARSIAWLGVGLLCLARAVVQLVHPVPTWLAVGATAAALVGVTCAAAGLGERRSLRSLPAALVAGLAVDTALRLPTGSWELVWQDGLAPATVAFGTVAAALIATGLAVRAPREEDPGIPGPALAAVGPFMMLQLVFLQNLGAVASQVPVSFPPAIAIVLCGDVLALAAVSTVSRVDERRRFGAAAIVGLAAVTLASVLPASSGPAAIAAFLGLQATAAGCLAVNAGAPGASRRTGTVVAVALGSLGFLLLALLWQLHIDRPLPFPRAVVPAMAGAWLAASAIASARRPARRTLSRRALVAVAALTAGALAVGTVTALVWPAPLDPRPGGASVTIVSFNVRGALGEDAMLDADAIAGSIAASDPDVVLLQEVARGWPVFGQGDLLARLAQRLRLPYRYEPAADAQFGNAILSRLPMTPVASGPLPEVDGTQRRSFLAVRVPTVGGPLVIADAHLEGGSTEQIDALLGALAGEAPLVIGGDLNLRTSDTVVVQRFVAAGLVDAEGATGDPCRSTSASPTSACDRPDWVWIGTPLSVTGFEIGPPSASDHLPVEVTVVLPSISGAAPSVE